MRDNVSEQYLAKIGFLRGDYLINMTKMQVILQEKPAIQLNHLDLTKLES